MAEKKKIFVVSGFHFHPYEHEHDIITEVFDTREKAAKCICDILTETFPMMRTTLLSTAVCGAMSSAPPTMKK